MNTEINEGQGARILSLVMMAAYENFDEALRIALKEGIPFQRDLIIGKARFFCGDEVADLLDIKWEAKQSVEVAGQDENRIAPAILSFKAFALALGQRIAIELSEIKAAIFQPIHGLGFDVATRNPSGEVNRVKAAADLIKWRIDLIEELRDHFRITLITDFPAVESVEFVVLGVNADWIENISNSPNERKLIASDAIRELWSGTIQTESDNEYAEISLAIPKNMNILSKDSHYKMALQQDAQGVWGVILKVKIQNG